VSYDAVPEERFELRLTDPRPPGFRARRGLWAPTARIIRGPMLRLLDVPGAIGARQAWPEVPPVRFTLVVSDSLLPENAGPWMVDFDGRVAQCTPGTGGAITLRTRAAGLAQIYAGELGVEEAVRIGLAEADGATTAIDALFRTGRTLRLLDEF
jgi:hypothetical protein